MMGGGMMMGAGKDHKSSMGHMAGMMGGGPMQMTGTVSMHGKPYEMRCKMSPVGKQASAGAGHMAGMSMDHPMKMTGTMTMAGQTYRCDMEMAPATAPAPTPPVKK